jgi:hypothetical protein
MITVSATAGGVELVREIELARQVEDMVDRNVVMRIVMREALSSRVADRKVGVLSGHYFVLLFTACLPTCCDTARLHCSLGTLTLHNLCPWPRLHYQMSL